MDIEMPEIDGIATTKLALEKNPDLKIVALSIYGDENYYTEMINAGAKGFILKNSDIVDVETAIQQVASGNNFFSPEILNRLIKGFGNKPAKSKSTDLTNREEEVLYHICKGLSNQEIADKLFLSKRTIDKHRENLLSKTNSKNTAGLVMFAVKNKIIDL
jgi:DNA-binding NarL/FixJ family response regulator